MQKSQRLVVCAFVMVSAFLFVGHALAAYSPKASVSADGSTTTLGFSQAATDEATASLSVYVPTSWDVNGLQTAGTAVGTLTAKAVFGQSGSPVLLKGSLEAAISTTPINLAGVDTTLGGAAKSCVGTPDASKGELLTGYFKLVLNGGGQSLQLPAYAVQFLPGNPLYDANIASYAITVCFASSAKVVSLTLVSTQVFTTLAPGGYLWHVLATPFTSGSATPNVAGRVELQSVVRLYPEVVVVRSKRLANGQVRVSGRVTNVGRGVTSAVVRLRVGTKVIGTAKTSTGGHFSVTVKLQGRRATKLVAIATLAPRSLAACPTQAVGAAPCLGASIGGWTVVSEAFLVKAGTKSS
jgi:hypothetical protein